MARQTQIEKKIAEINKQIDFLTAVRDALYDAQGKGRTTPAVKPTPRKKPTPPSPVTEA